MTTSHGPADQVPVFEKLDRGKAGASAWRVYERRPAATEERVGAALDRLRSERLRVLHDRRVPGSGATVDHLVVAPSGVYVIDAKASQGRPERRAEGGQFRPGLERLFVGGQDRTRALEGVLDQVEVVRRALADEAVPVRGYLCLVGADWPLLAPPFAVRGVTVLWPRKLTTLLVVDGPQGPSRVEHLHCALAKLLPPA